MTRRTRAVPHLVGAVVALGLLLAAPGLAQAPDPGAGATTSTSGAPPSSATTPPAGATTTTPPPPAPPRVRLVSKTPWVTPGGELRLVISATDVPDPATVDVAVSLFPRITNRADLSASFTGDGLKGALWQLAGGAVHLTDLPSSTDGSRTITIPTQDPAAPLDRTRARVQSGIYPVEVQLVSQATGETIDRLFTHLLAPDTPKDGSRLGVVTVLPISARPTVTAEGTRPGPPEGTAAIAAMASGLAAVPNVAVTAVPTPETLEALAAGSTATAKSLAAALADRTIVARPYVPLQVPSLGDQAGPVLTAQLEAGNSATTAALGRAPTTATWVADEPLDTQSLGELAAIGVDQLIVSGNDLTAPAARSDKPAPATVPRQPVPVTAGGGRAVQALVADPALSTHTDPATPAADQPLAAHQLLTELAGIVLLPQVRGGPVPQLAGLGAGAATVLPPRAWRPTEAFVTELLRGIASSPILVGVDPAAAFALAAPVPVPATSAPVGRRTTTTTIPSNERSLVRRSTVDDRLGRTMAVARGTFAAHDAVLPDAPKADVSSEQRLLVAASADLAVDEQLRRLSTLNDAFEADLDKIRIPGDRDLRLTSRAGDLPIGIINDAPAQARVILRVSSEKLEFPGGTDRLITLGRQNTTEQVRVRARAAGAFPLLVTLLSPDGTKVLDQAEYRVRSNSLPGVGIAVSVAAGLVLAFWWGKTLLFQPRGAHLRGRG